LETFWRTVESFLRMKFPLVDDVDLTRVVTLASLSER
jgi:hypothetical protein